MVCWFDANDTPTGGTALSSWKDKGPLRLDLSQATGSKQPIVRQYGRTGERGPRSVGGDATDDIISHTGITNNILDGAFAAHIFAVVSITSASGYWMSFPAAGAGNGFDLQNGTTFHRRGTVTLESVSGSVTADGVPRLVEGIYDDSMPTNKYQTLLETDAAQSS